MRNVIKSFLVFALFLIILSGLRAQNLAPFDSAYDKRITAAWKEIQTSNSQKQTQAAADDPQRKFATEFMSYYSDHPDTKVGRKAAQSAFMIWGNIGDVKSIRAAMNRIQSDSELWPLLLNSVGSAYAREKEWNEFLALLDTLSHKLTHPRSLAEVLLKLGSENVLKSNDSLGRLYYRRVLALDADSNQRLMASQGFYEIDSLAVGSPAPDFSGVSVTGRPIHLAGMRGTNVLLEFTGTWCVPCQGELPYLKDAFSRYAPSIVSFVAVSLDDSASTVLRYLGDKQIGWPHILAPEYNDNFIVRKYNVQGIPRIFLIDTMGRIAAKNLRQEGIKAALAGLATK